MGIIQYMNEVDAINRRKYPSKAEIFLESTMTWSDEDRTIWSEVWSETQRKDYMDTVIADDNHGIITPSPSIYAMIQAVE